MIKIEIDFNPEGKITVSGSESFACADEIGPLIERLRKAQALLKESEDRTGEEFHQEIWG